MAQRIAPWSPPVKRREFWGVQTLVLAIAVGHDVIETIARPEEPPALYLLPTSLYFVPVVYAALNFGLRGSLATALWCAVLTLPNVLLWHSGAEQFGVVWQLGILLGVAAFVGERVDRETRARGEAEEREKQRRRSEARYRGLFDGAAEGVLVLEPDGTIVEANATAGDLLATSADALRGVALADVVGPWIADRLLHPTKADVVALPAEGGGTTWVQPVIHGSPRDMDGRWQTQLMLQDVSHQYERQRDLEAYARQAVAAREEERRRIGRELHDGPLQTLVLLFRKLDEIGRRDGDVVTPVADARELADATANELRRISRALRPSVLDDLGIAAALKSEATALGRRTGLRVRFTQVGDPVNLLEEVELALLRIAQEALHNVERHAFARSILVRLEWESQRVSLVVRDDGQGLGSLPSASDLLEAGKLGVVGMQERARLLGGEVTVEGGPRAGTTVQAFLPVLGDLSNASHTDRDAAARR